MNSIVCCFMGFNFDVNPVFGCYLRGEPFCKMVEMGVKSSAARLYHVSFINLQSSRHGDFEFQFAR